MDEKKLIIKALKPLWLAIDPKTNESIAWVTEKPEKDNGYIEEGTILIFDHFYRDALNFKMITPGSIFKPEQPEFLPAEIPFLLGEQAITLQEQNDINELSIVDGIALVQAVTGATFDLPALISKEIYIIINGKKIPFKDIIETYQKHQE